MATQQMKLLVVVSYGPTGILPITFSRDFFENILIVDLKAN